MAYNVPKNLKGEPSTKPHPPEELKSSIAAPDSGYDTLSEEWNEYFVEDGTKIRIKDTVARISRTNKYNKDGDPIYLVDHSSIA
ncbi:MAG: hypothetical protein ACE5GD_00330 [Candidatus Geothermarchaeales archaeon]